MSKKNLNLYYKSMVPSSKLTIELDSNIFNIKHSYVCNFYLLTYLFLSDYAIKLYKAILNQCWQ